MAKKTLSAARPRIFTIGHSNRTFPEFVAILEAYKLKQLIDIRTVPKSRHNPQFGSVRLARALERRGIAYEHMADLGGWRHARKDSPNTAWRNAAFRGYADYMRTPEFARALDHLVALSKRRRLVLMCAEAVPWRCHRSLVGDALLARGIPVEDIMSGTSHRPHRLTAFAKVRGECVTYPGGPAQAATPPRAKSAILG